jgi:predicted GIY-YIG superfamily endonuclease
MVTVRRRNLVNARRRFAPGRHGWGRYTRANPPLQLLTRFACRNQSVAGRLEAAIKKLAAGDKKELVGKTSAQVRRALLP